MILGKYFVALLRFYYFQCQNKIRFEHTNKNVQLNCDFKNCLVSSILRYTCMNSVKDLCPELQVLNSVRFVLCNDTDKNDNNVKGCMDGQSCEQNSFWPVFDNTHAPQLRL